MGICVLGGDAGDRYGVLLGQADKGAMVEFRETLEDLIGRQMAPRVHVDGNGSPEEKGQGEGCA